MSIPRSTLIVLVMMSCIFCTLVSYSQTKGTLSKKDRKAFTKDSIYIMRVKFVRPQFRVDNRSIFFKGQMLNSNGLDAGVLLKEKLRLTLGYYWLNDNLDTYRITENNMELNRNLDLKYGSINTEFIYKKTRFISLGMPLDFGFGKNSLQYKNPATGEIRSHQSGLIILTDFGLSATLKPTRWIGIKGIVGYRKTLFNEVKNFHFDGLFTSIGLAIDIREIVKDVQMFQLKKKYKRNRNSVETAVDLITD